MKRTIILVSKSGLNERCIDATTATDLMVRYGVIGHTFNAHGQVIYLASRKGNRLHSLVILKY